MPRSATCAPDVHTFTSAVMSVGGAAISTMIRPPAASRLGPSCTRLTAVAEPSGPEQEHAIAGIHHHSDGRPAWRTGGVPPAGGDRVRRRVQLRGEARSVPPD